MQQLKINSPATVVEGESYTVRLTVTNQSTKAGIPVEATLEIVIHSATAFTTLIPVTASMEAFGAGQTRSFSFPMNVPLGSGGETGQITAIVRDPTGAELARATEGINIEAIIPPALAGSIGPGYIWYEGIAGWESLVSGREIPTDEMIYLAPSWVNESEVNITGHVDLLVTYPDGSEVPLPATLNQDKEAAPGSGWGVQFQPFSSTQEGTYTLTATLYSAGQVLDSITFTLVGVSVVPPRGNITASLSIPRSAKGGTTVHGSITYQVTGYVEWAKLYVTSYGSSREIPLLTTPGTYTVPISVYQPSDGYLYHRVTIVIYGGVLYEWSGWFFSQEVKIYLEE